LKQRQFALQINDQVINTGTITYKRKTTPIDKFDYTYWSSPVKDQTLLAVSIHAEISFFRSIQLSITGNKNPSNLWNWARLHN
jgi:hypothetical protein